MEKLIPRLFNPPKGSFFLFGPRGTGKTTWLHLNYSDAIFIDLLEADTFRSYSARPERIRELISGNPKTKVFVIDEIQRVPELLSEVHGLIEKQLGIQFILTGSSSRKLKRSQIDLMAGRAAKFNIHPFIASELGDNFDIERALQYGLIPLIVKSKDSQTILRSYAALYVREEVQMEGLVRNIGNFSRFLEAISFSHSCVLNISNVSRECEIERKVVESYISILEDLLLCHRIPVFTKKAKRKVISHPKFYYFDAGLFRSLRPQGPLDRREEIDGAALEGLVAQHLIAWNDYSGNKNNLYYWRTKAGSEIDFIIYGKTEFLAIEVKNSNKIRREDLTALKTFISDYPEAKAILLYRGKEQRKIDNVLCVPCEKFLLALRPNAKVL